MSVPRLRLPALALLSLAGAACLSLPAMAQLPGLGAPALPPGTTESATDAAVDAVKSRARKPAPAPAKGKKARAEAVPRNGALVVTNQRSVNLLELTATPQNGGAAVVISRDLAAGARANGKLPPKAGCVFSLSGTFDDETTMDAANMNLCKDGRINLVE